MAAARLGTTVQITVTGTLPDPLERPLLAVPEAGASVGWSRDTSYRAARSGAMPTIRFGRRLFVPTAEWRRLLGLDGAP